MFTFKKIALAGVAGLAAFSMSCSDDKGSAEAGGKFTVPFSISTDDEGFIVLAGEITATDPNEVNSLKFEANGKDVGTASPIAIDKKVVKLDDSKLVGVCPALESKDENQKVTIKVIAKFTDAGAAALEATSNEVTIDCKNNSSDGKLIKKNIILSNGGTSYADIDGKTQTYKGTEITDFTAIDLVAYTAPSSAAVIQTPLAHGGIFGTGAGFKGSDEVEFYALPSMAINIIKSLEYADDITEEYQNILDGIIMGDSIEDGTVEIAEDTGFLVWTSEGDVVAVIITDSKTALSVGLSITGGLTE